MTWLWTPLWSLRELSLNKGDLFLFLTALWNFGQPTSDTSGFEIVKKKSRRFFVPFFDFL
jgi:hypothetical protein